jgi:hypothetical protein
MHIKTNGSHATNDGILEAFIDFGLFKGTVAMGLYKQRLLAWFPHYNQDAGDFKGRLRLKERAIAARAKLGMPHKTFTERANLDFDRSQPLPFYGTYRCIDDCKLFMKASRIASDRCLLQFQDVMGLQLK